MKITERELRKLYSEDLLTDEEIGDLYGIKQIHYTINAVQTYLKGVLK